MSVNAILFQPISIFQPYLYNVVADFLRVSKSGVSQSSALELEQKFKQQIELQSESAINNGADTFPVVVPVRGAIVKYSSWGYIGTQTLTKIVKRLDTNPQVSHIIFDIDSGGGMVSGTTEFSETIRNCSTPTVAFTNGYACSAAQQIFSAAEIGVVSPYADLMGSIGTYISYQDWSSMFEKYGAKLMEVYAPQSEMKNKMFRDWKAGDETAIKEYLKNHADDFASIMKSYRGDKLKDDGKVFKGDVYTPKQALEVGLADKMMTFDELINNL